MIRRPTPRGGSTSSSAPCSRPTLHPARSPRTRFPGWPACVASIDDQRQLLATENGLYVRDIADGRLTLHAALEADNAATRSNDGRVHPCGALWIGTMGRKAEKGAGAIYHFGGGELRRLYAGISIPNAICFSPDGATAYFTDSQRRHPLSRRHRSRERPADRRSRAAVRPPRRGRRPRRRRGRCRRADLECALGRFVHRCLYAGR